MANPTSFMNLLKKWVIKIKPKNIFEWGPGYSTHIMRNMCPESYIVTMEHQQQFYDEWKKTLNVTILLREAPESDRKNIKWKDYCEPEEFEKEKFDLIFVDGRERVRCAKWAKEHLNKNGVIILHDSERPEYDEVRKFLKVVEEESGTCVLKLL